MTTGDCCARTGCSPQSPSERANPTLNNGLRTPSFPVAVAHDALPCTIERFDELTEFFNLINRLFRQSTFTLGLSSHQLTPLFHVPEMNAGVSMQIDRQNFERIRIGLSDVVLYTSIGRNRPVSDTDDCTRQDRTTSTVKFHAAERSLTLSVRQRWSPSLISTVRLGSKAQKRLWSHVEYRRPFGTYELVGEYGLRPDSTGIQFSCLSNLWQCPYYQLDGGLDFKITSKGVLADVAVRLRRPATSLVFKCDLARPSAHYLLALQHRVHPELTVGLLAESVREQHRPRPKVSLISQWHSTEFGVRVNAFLNSDTDFGAALTHPLRHLPVLLQTFASYSWRTSQCKWGIGLQILV